ncbi:unnamed protein product [Linum trigynum]|uniref:Uncharacterized protein n=1 Tax=Linum trigynum TaxID=586398 RepID=A0AAV2G392_9ROSI
MSADCVSSPAQSYYNLCWPEKLPRLTMAGTVPMKRIKSGSQGLEGLILIVRGLGKESNWVPNSVLYLWMGRRKSVEILLIWSDPGGPGMWKKRLSLRAGRPLMITHIFQTGKKVHRLICLPRFQPENLELNKAIFEIATREGCTPSPVALAWVHHRGDDNMTVIRYGEGILTFKDSDAPPLSSWKPNGK